MIPSNAEFDAIEKHITDVLFSFIMAGRCNTSVKVNEIRWFVDRESEGWMIHIFGLGTDAPMELDTISLYLLEKGYNVENIEIVLEGE